MNTQELDLLFQETIGKLKRNERPLIKLSPELIVLLKEAWNEAVHNETKEINEKVLRQILCILDNTQNMSREFHEHFFVTMEKLREKIHSDENSTELLIYTLAASQKHVVAEAFKSGVMIPGTYFDQLKKLLETKNPEVLEWTLRTVESMGPMSLRFQKEIRSLRPSWLNIFNQHQKASFQIIELLEKEWARLKL